MRILIILLCSLSFAFEAVAVDPQEANETKKLILPGESFLVENRPAFILWPVELLRKTPQPCPGSDSSGFNGRPTSNEFAVDSDSSGRS